MPCELEASSGRPARDRGAAGALLVVVTPHVVGRRRNLDDEGLLLPLDMAVQVGNVRPVVVDCADGEVPIHKRGETG